MTRGPHHGAVRRPARLVTILALAAGLAACRGEDPEPAGGSAPAAGSSATSTATGTPDETADPTPPDDEPFGPGCRRYLAGSGLSLDEIARTPAPAFVLRQPSLQDAFGKMMQLGLVSERDVTFFVPTNQAINALPVDVRGELVGDEEKARTFFGHHVAIGRLAPSALAGDHRTVAEDTLTVTVSGEDVGVGLQGAHVVCGNIETRDATVYVIDQALQS